MSGKKSRRRTFLRQTGAAALLGTVAGCTGTQDQSDEDTTTETTTTTTEDSEDAEKAEWIISGSNEGSPANTWTQGFAATVDEYSDTLALSPQFVNGWRNATVKLDDGTFDLSLYLWLFLYEIEHNEGPYAEDGKIGPLEKEHRGVTPPVHLSVPFFATYADNDDIETIHDLDGKRVATDVVGSSLMANLGRIVESAGVDINWEHMTWSEMGNAIQTNRFDAATPLAINGTTLVGPLAKAFESVDMKGVQIPSDVIEGMDSLEFITVNGDNLNASSQIDEVQAPANPSGIFTTADKDPDLVYEFVSILLDNQDELGQYHPALEQFGIGEGRHNFTGIPNGVEFHEGAVRYFEEEDIDYPGM